MKRMLPFLLLIIVLLPFQNCYQYDPVDLPSSSSKMGGQTVDNGNSLNSALGNSTGSSTTLSLLDMQKQCLNLLREPILNHVGATDVAIASGYGTAATGDVASADIDVSIAQTITNKAEFDRLGCNSVVNYSLQCSVDTAATTVINRALDANGNNLLSTKSQLDVAKMSFMNQDACTINFTKGSLSAKFSIRPNTNMSNNIGPVRCAEGSYTLKLMIKGEVQMANAPTGLVTSYNSNAKSLKVAIKNSCWNESRLRDLKETQQNVSDFGSFGSAVAISNDWAAVLAPNDDASTSVINVGSVYMYALENSKWVFKQKVMVNDSLTSESLNSVALNGSTMVVGSTQRESQGMVYFYRKSGATWNLIQQIRPEVSQANQQFGYSVALNSSYLIVGAPKYTADNLSGRGAVSVYQYNETGAKLVSILTGDAANSGFGSSVSLDETNMAIGAPQNLGKESQAAGSVFIFTLQGTSWSLASKKVGTTIAERFGDSVSVLGKKLLVGSPNFSSTNKTANGRASYFDNYTSTTAPAVWAGLVDKANLGQSVALNSQGVFIGSPFAVANTFSRAGTVDFYKYASLAKISYQIIAYNSSKDSAFGCAVSVSDTDVLVGARIKSSDLGEAYIYRYQ